MNHPPDCPLTPALLETLQTALDLSTLETSRLAEATHKSPKTIRTDLARIRFHLSSYLRREVHNSHEALVIAEDKGWIKKSIPPAG